MNPRRRRASFERTTVYPARRPARDSRLCGATAHVSTGSIEGCDAARAPVLTALRPFVRERVCARGARGSVPHRHPRAGRASGSANCERNRPGPGFPRAARAREHGRIRSRIVRTEICNSGPERGDRHRHRDCGLGTIGSSVESSVIVVAILSRAGVHRTRHAESHNRAKRARLTGHRVPPGAGSDRSQPTRRHRPYMYDTPTLDRSSGSSPIISFRRASHIYYDQ